MTCDDASIALKVAERFRPIFREEYLNVPLDMAVALALASALDAAKGDDTTPGHPDTRQKLEAMAAIWNEDPVICDEDGHPMRLPIVKVPRTPPWKPTKLAAMSSFHTTRSLPKKE